MNYKIVGYYLGQILRLMTAFLLLPIIVAICYGEFSLILSFLAAAAVYFALGCVLISFHQEKTRKPGNKEALVVVGLAWIVISLIGALPFTLSGTIASYIDAFFETVSGFTTTGATILTHIDDLPRSMLFWRSFTHWLGGMGILVFILAIMPGTDGSTFALFKFESPGPQVGKLTSKVRWTATILYIIYLCFTLTEILILAIYGACSGKIDFFDSLLIGLSTAGTGGFAPSVHSIGKYDSLFVEIVVMAFMFLFSINFNLYYLVILRHFKVVFGNEELRFYLIYIILAIVAVTAGNVGYFGSVLSSLRYSSFAVLTIVSSTGFASYDFTLWSSFSQIILLCCMFIGSMAGSTGGGFKMSRFIILNKSIHAHFLNVLRPNSIQIVKLNGKALNKDEVSSVEKYFAVFAGIVAISTLFLALNGTDLFTTFTCTLTCINNMGPGFTALTGPSGSFAIFEWYEKLWLSIVMLIGRLEIFPVLLLFLPQTWKKNF